MGATLKESIKMTAGRPTQSIIVKQYSDQICCSTELCPRTKNTERLRVLATYVGVAECRLRIADWSMQKRLMSGVRDQTSDVEQTDQKTFERIRCNDFVPFHLSPSSITSWIGDGEEIGLWQYVGSTVKVYGHDRAVVKS
jgi:hypothetical protein